MATATTKGTSVNGTAIAVNGSLSTSPLGELLQEPPKSKTETVTFKHQQKLPKLPIPPLADTCRRYLSAVKPLQTQSQHKATEVAVRNFLETDGPELNDKLHSYATDKSSYIEEFWYDSYLQYQDSVVLHLNPFFLLEDDPTPNRNDQLWRAASLILSACNFVIALRTETLEPDVFRGTPLDMSQFLRLFGTARLPSEEGCVIASDHKSRHIVVVCRSQFYWFDVLHEGADTVALSDKEIAANLKAIKKDAANIPVTEIAKTAVGVLTTENRRIWAGMREALRNSSPENMQAVEVIDSALFVVCLDDVSPSTPDELSMNMLCGTYKIQQGVQTGTCTNRWYDKLQFIVCENGSAGVNFEHTGVDGHTVLRMVSDVYTDTILRFAHTINAATKSLFHSYALPNKKEAQNLGPEPDVTPKRIEWVLKPEVRGGIRFAETRLSDLILQNEVKVLEFSSYGKAFITSVKMSPDAFVQMAFQSAYYGLYGKCESTYEPAMTKSFLHGRTEAIRTVTTESVDFVRGFCSEQSPAEKVRLLRLALDRHTALTKECSKGLGQDRHLYALECLWKRINGDEIRRGEYVRCPSIFVDSGWTALNNTVISTSNCGNPALRSFGFGPVVADGFGIGYIIKEEAISLVVSSKHRQTARFVQTIHSYLLEIQKILLADRNPSPLASRQYRLQLEEDGMLGGYGYFDAGDLGDLEQRRMEEKERQRAGPVTGYLQGRAIGRRLNLGDGA